MKKIIMALCAATAMSGMSAVYMIDGQRVEGEVHEEGGMRMLCTDEMCFMLPDDAVPLEEGNGAAAEQSPQLSAPEVKDEVIETPVEPQVEPSLPEKEFRLAQGYMSPEELLAFIKDEEKSSDYFGGKSMWLIVLLIFLGGIAMNLTPCVLPMIPVNLMIIGKSAARGAWYGLGIALAYGVLGLMASLGGMAFGAIQSNPWFNLAVAAIFVALALSMFGVFAIDFTKHRAGMKGGAFVMGILSAVLAGACVAPILIAVLLLTADLVAQGKYVAVALPFVLGLGMALPWPFAGAGMQCLPKPGMWMTKVNKLFGVIVLGFAAWYGYLAWQGFAGSSSEVKVEEEAKVEENVIAATPATFGEALSKAGERPVFVDCWATWCKNCTAMEKTTLCDPTVVETLKDYAIIKLQAENINELRKLSGFSEVKGLPAFAVSK